MSEHTKNYHFLPLFGLLLTHQHFPFCNLTLSMTIIKYCHAIFVCVTFACFFFRKHKEKHFSPISILPSTLAASYQPSLHQFFAVRKVNYLFNWQIHLYIVRFFFDRWRAMLWKQNMLFFGVWRSSGFDGSCFGYFKKQFFFHFLNCVSLPFIYVSMKPLNFQYCSSSEGHFITIIRQLAV